MKVFLASVIAAVVLSVGAWFVLSMVQTPAYEAFSTTGASVREPGENLVGKNWTGNPPNG